MEALKTLIKNKILILITVVIPILSALIYAEIYKSEILEELPVLVIDNDNTELSRQLVKMYDESPTIKIIGEHYSIEDIKSRLIEGNAFAALIIPRNFGNEIKKGKQAKITFLKASRNVILSNLLLKESAMIGKMFSSKVFAAKQIKAGIIKPKAEVLANPIVINTQSIFNPSYSYLNYLVPGLILFTLQLAAMLSGSLILDISNNTKRKTLGYIILLNIIISLFIVFVQMPLMNIEVVKRPLLVFGLIIYSEIIAVFIGYAIASVTRGGMLAVESVIFYATPAFIFSGLTFPIWGMPIIHQFYSKIIPFSYVLESYIKIAEMGGGLLSSLNELLALTIFLLISALTIIFSSKSGVAK